MSQMTLKMGVGKVLKKEVNCAPCRNINCQDKSCLEAITVDEVVDAIDDMIKNW
jgi:ADP-heptose:LPS heptosyltransferase